MSCMIIEYSGGGAQFNPCPSRTHDTEPVSDKPIPRFYSSKHATINGWRATSDIKFCEPGLEFVWVCPECAKGNFK